VSLDADRACEQIARRFVVVEDAFDGTSTAGADPAAGFLGELVGSGAAARHVDADGPGFAVTLELLGPAAIYVGAAAAFVAAGTSHDRPLRH
jgi:hypothetical protein